MNPELLILMVCADVLFIAQQEKEFLEAEEQKKDIPPKDSEDSKEQNG